MLDLATAALEFQKQRGMWRLQHCSSKRSTVAGIPVLESKQQRWTGNSNAGPGNCCAGIQKITRHVATPALQFKQQHCCGNSSAGIQTARWIWQLLRWNSKNNAACGDSSAAVQREHCCGDSSAGIQTAALDLATATLEFKKQRGMWPLRHCSSNSSTAVAFPALELKK
jgi:hypothetical protein